MDNKSEVIKKPEDDYMHVEKVPGVVESAETPVQVKVASLGSENLNGRSYSSSYPPFRVTKEMIDQARSFYPPHSVGPQPTHYEGRRLDDRYDVMVYFVGGAWHGRVERCPRHIETAVSPDGYRYNRAEFLGMVFMVHEVGGAGRFGQIIQEMFERMEFRGRNIRWQG